MFTKRTLNAFSLVELLITLAIIAIIGAVIMNTYNGIQNSAIAVAQQKDTAELNQVMAQLHMSGGNLLAILSPPPTIPFASTTTYQAGALTWLLQQNINSASMTQKGTVGGSSLPTSECIIPFPYTGVSDDGRNRIVFSATGMPSIAKSTSGFIAVNTTNSKDWQAFKNNRTNLSMFSSGYNVNSTAGTAAVSNTAGSKFNSSNSYVWDEDASTQQGPQTNNDTPLLKPTVELVYMFGNGSQSGNFNIADYMGQSFPDVNGGAFDPTAGTLYVFAFLSNGKDMTAGDVTLAPVLGSGGSALAPVVNLPGPVLVSVSGLAATTAPAALAAAVGGSNNSMKGLLWTLPLNSIFPAINNNPGVNPTYWSNSNAQPLALNATPVNPAYNSAISPVSITLSPVMASLSAPPTPPAGTTLSPGGSLTISANPIDGSVAAIAPASSSPVTDPGATITDTSTGFTDTSSDASSGTTDTLTGTVDSSGNLDINFTQT